MIKENKPIQKASPDAVSSKKIDSFSTRLNQQGHRPKGAAIPVVQIGKNINVSSRKHLQNSHNRVT